MTNEALLGWFIVVGADNHDAICARFEGSSGRVDCFVGCVRSCSCNHGDTPGGDLDGPADDLEVLVWVESGALSGCPARKQTVDAQLYLALDECFEGVKIDVGSVWGERCHEGRVGTVDV